ncbi:MAG: serine hydrolase, partial [Pseudohongiellaceae bacterium]
SDPIPTLVQTLDGHELSNVGPVFMERPPMTSMEYSGGGVSVMQQALTDARRRPFPELMKETVLAPIGMNNSTFAQPLTPTQDENAARAHNAQGQSMGSKWHIYPAMAAAGLWTTASDLARFAVEVQKSAVNKSNKVLTREMVMEMLTPVGVGPYAVGFGISQQGQGWYFGHSGSDWGFQANLRAHRAKGYGFALMTNSDRGGALMQEIARRIELAYEWDSIAAPTPRGYLVRPQGTGVEVETSLLEQYAGTYAFTSLSLAMDVVDGRLAVQRAGQDRQVLLLAESDNSFYVPGFGARIVFTVDENGEVNEATLERSGKPQPGRRIER